MSLEENKETFQKYIEAYNSRNFSAFDDLISPEYVDPDFPGMKGPQGLKEVMRKAFQSFPDYSEKIEDLIAEGEKCGFFLVILELTLENLWDNLQQARNLNQKLLIFIVSKMEKLYGELLFLVLI